MTEDRTVTGSFGGHVIEANIFVGLGNGLLQTVTLSVDNKEIVKDNQTFLANLIMTGFSPLIRKKYDINGKEREISVYIKSGITKDKIKICLDGKFLGGENF